MTKNVYLLPFLLLTGVIQTGQTQTYKVGDYVDYHFNGVPPVVMHCKVRSLIGAHYNISCGATDYFADAPVLSPRAATADDQKAEAETVAALARQASRNGNSLGGQYGSREPATCANRTAPAKGGPSADQARQYVICDTEIVFAGSLTLVTDVKVQVAPVSHPPNNIVMEMHAADLKPGEQIWDIRGSLTSYQCAKLASIPGWPDGINSFAHAHTCNVADMPTAAGYCYKNTFGDWHCSMSGPAVNTRQNVLPPEGN